MKKTHLLEESPINEEEFDVKEMKRVFTEEITEESLLENQENGKEMEHMKKDSDEEDDEEIVIMGKFKQRDSYSVQMNRMKKNKEKEENDEEKIVEENETEMKKWSEFVPMKKKKRGSYFVQLKKMKELQKKVVSFNVEKKNKEKKNEEIKENQDILDEKNEKIEEREEITEEKHEEKVEISSKTIINKPEITINSERTQENYQFRKEKTMESSDEEVIPKRTIHSVDILIKKHDSSSSEDEGVKDYQKWDKFNPQKKRKRPLSFANKKPQLKVNKTSKFHSARPSKEENANEN